jgi:type VI secretion system protein ImpH
MATATRRTAGDLAEPLLRDAQNQAFFGLVEQLHRLHGDNLQHCGDLEPANDRIVFESDRGLGFPASDVRQASRVPGARHVQYRLIVSFLGLHGPDSPLPGHFVDTIAGEEAGGESLRGAFLDFFHHRLLTLLHRGWRKYRYHVRFQSEARDRFSRYVFSLIGLNDDRLRGETPIPWSRLLTYAGLVASRSRSPAVVSGIVAHCFDLDSVEVREYQPMTIDVPADQRTCVGAAMAVLGESFTVGDRVTSCEQRFVLSIANLSQTRFRDFLPNGKDFLPLRRLVEFLLRDQLAYDLELGLRRDEIPPFRLDAASGGHLGWTTFVGNAPLQQVANVTIRVRA